VPGLIDHCGKPGHITGTWDVPWLATMVDQAWHVVVLALATLL